jgi:hypothetical protein
MVRPNLQRHLMSDGSELKAADIFVDFSAYASVGLERSPAWGGVCRGSPSRIVNIVGGGAVLPLLREEIWSELEQALECI